VTGCYAQRDPQALAGLPGVSLVVGNAGRDGADFASAVADPGLAGRILHQEFDAARDFLVPSMSETGGKTRPFIKLQDGCDARCSYCIVPSVRGPGRSARPDSIVAEARALVEKGYQEIVLTGVHLGTYGRKLAEPVKLVDVLRRLLRIEGLGRVRLSSIEPMRFDRAIIGLARDAPALAPHFHVPLQSGSDRILRRMRRPYTAARFRALLEYAHSQLPHAAFGTDVLVGFPGETDEDFELTRSTVRESPLTYLHVFPFSAREGTDAWALPDRVPAAVVRERVQALRDLSQAKNYEFRRRFRGKLLPALTLSAAERLGDSVVLTENYIHTRVAGHGCAPNRLVQVCIEEVQPGWTRGRVI
jgi:threonylcarbamoyladenosine tRNA methylthiotransferase MtaB